MSSSSRLSLASFSIILLSSLLVTAAEVFLKAGAADTADRSMMLPWLGPWLSQWLGLSGLGSWKVWVGIVLTVLSFGAWIRAVQAVPLNIAFTFSNVVHVFIPVSCWLILGETISPRRWLGIALVVTGLLVAARPFAYLDEKLEKAL